MAVLCSTESRVAGKFHRQNNFNNMKTRIRCLAMFAWGAALLVGCVIATGIITGCQSTSPSQYIAPRVEGRVLDAQSRQPLGGVTVRRVNPGAEAATGEVPKGAQAIAQAPDIRSGNDGAFALASDRSLQLFRRSGWYSVAISFKHAGYASFMTNYTRANATNTSGREPLVRTGDILLVPLSR